MDPKSPYEEIDLEYNNQQFKVYIYKHPNLIKDSAVFIVKLDPLMKKHIEAVEDYNYSSRIIKNTGKSSPHKRSIYKAIITAIGKHFYSE